MKRKAIALITAIILTTIAWISSASSPDAWDAFRQDVRDQCTRELKNHLTDPDIILDPFGTSSSGLALGVGRSHHSEEDYIIICVYDKRDRTVELASEIKLEDIPIYQRLLDENRKLREESDR